MAVKTHFTDSDLAGILANYDLGSLTGSEPISEGTVQTNLHLFTSGGRFVLRYYENRTPETVAFELDLLGFLKGHRFPCPRLIQTTSGDLCLTHRKKPLALFEFARGRHPENLSKRQLADLIRHVARLHVLTESFAPVNSEDRWKYTPDFCARVAREKVRSSGTQHAFDKADWLQCRLDQLELPSALPCGISHCDFDRSNLLFEDDVLTALLDFDDANITYRAFDLVHLIEHAAWPFGHDIDLRAARSVVAEYERFRPLKEVEKDYFLDVFKLSVLIDSLWFFDRGRLPVFYEKEKLEQLDAFDSRLLTG